MMVGNKKNYMWAGLCAIVYIVLFWCLMPFVYSIIDDRSMMEFVSGQYLGTPDAHTIFMGYWYSLFLAKMYTMVPQVDWYALCYVLLQGICMSLVFYRLFSIELDKKKKGLYLTCIVMLFIILGLQAMVQLTFTTTAAVLGVTVIIWYMTVSRIRFVDWLILFLLCFFTAQIRSSVFFMILPVCGILWLFRLREEGGKEKWDLMVPAAVALVFVLSLAGNQVGYGSPEWKAYQKYNANRSEVYDYADYTFRPYEGAEDFYHQIGIEKKSRARTLINYNYTADDQITPEFFDEYITAYEEAFPSGETIFEKGLTSVKEYIKGILNGKFHTLHIVALLLYIGLAVWYWGRKDRISCWKVIAVAGIQVLLWVYLIFEGRIPERVIYSMNLMLIVTELLLWMEAFKDIRIPDKAYKPGVIALLLGLGILAVAEIGTIRQQNLEMRHRNEDIESLKEYCMEHPENFYFNDVTSMTFTTYNVHLWKQEPYIMNYMSLGDWMSYSPIWQEKLKGEGITSVKDALYTQENVYLICSFEKGLEYLVKLYDGVSFMEEDKIPGFTIYKLEIP